MLAAAMLKHALCTITYYLLQKLVHIASIMYNNAVRFGFGPRSTQEAAAALLDGYQEGALREDTAMVDRDLRKDFDDYGQPVGEGANLQDGSRLLHDDDDEHRDLANPDQIWDPEHDTLISTAHTTAHAAYNAHAHYSYPQNTHSHPTGATDHHMPMVTLPSQEPVFRWDSDAETVMHGEDMPPLIDGPPTPHPHGAQQHVSQPDYGVPFIALTETESAAMGMAVEPVYEYLWKLKETTVPDYYPGLRATSNEKMLAVRLREIAQFVQLYFEPSSDTGRGVVELRFW